MQEFFLNPLPLFSPPDSAKWLFQVILHACVNNMCQQLSSFSHEVVSSPQKISGRAHFLWVDIGQREHSASELTSYFSRINFIVFGFTTMNSLHVQSMAQYKIDACLLTEICNLVPGEHTLHPDNHILSKRLNISHKYVRVSVDVLCKTTSAFWLMIHRYIFLVWRSIPQ